MRSLRIDSAFESVDDPASSPLPDPATAPVQGRVWRRLAAFLLGLTLGMSGIVIGESAFDSHRDLFGPGGDPPVLRR